MSTWKRKQMWQPSWHGMSLLSPKSGKDENFVTPLLYFHFRSKSAEMAASSTNSGLEIVQATGVQHNVVQQAGVQQNGEDGKCFCGYPRLERTSWRYNTPGRRFWNCPNSMTKRRKCEYFDWKDPLLKDQCYKDLLLSLKAELDKKENISELTFTRRKLQEMELLMAHEKHVYEKELLEMKHENAGLKHENAGLKLENAGLKLENAGLKSWVNYTRGLLVFCIVGMAACGMKLVLG